MPFLYNLLAVIGSILQDIVSAHTPVYNSKGLPLNKVGKIDDNKIYIAQCV